MASEAIGYPEQGSSAAARLELAPNVRSALRGLRRRIRLYVWVEGLVLAFIWLGLTFWLALAVDYLTVYFAGAELPVWIRAVILLGVGAGLLFILAYWVFARAFARLPDHSMAVLLERRFAGFGDSLVTAVEMSEDPDHAQPFSREMLDQANQRAQAQIESVRLAEVFNVRRLIWKFVAAVLLLLPAGLVWGQTLQTGIDRLVLLKNVDWPRSARIEVVGVQVQRAVVDPNLPAAPLVPFEDRSIKVARHSSLTLHVRADVTAPKVPEFCTIWYTTIDGDRGRVIMKKIGRPRDQFQQYTFDEKPLKGILSSLDFSVRGYDHRLHDYHVEVVDNPAVINTKLQCEFPAYMVDEQLSQWLPQTRELTSSTQLPTGTRIRILATCNKPLEKVVIVNTETQEQAVLEIAGGGTQFEYDVPSLMGNLSLDVTLFDTDGVMTDKPHRIYIVAIEDQPPQVDVVLRGIGTAVTPDVLIPARGKVDDDYAVAETWFEAVVDDAEPVVFPAPLQAAGKFDGQLDFRQQRSQEGGLQLNVGQKLVLGVKASDKFDLGGGSPNLGAGDTYQLEVVSPDQLLALLERRELGLRQRFEQIIDEVTAMRDSLVRVQTDLRGGAKLSEGEPEAGDAARDPEADAQRARSLRVLWTQRALIQSQKSAQEVLGVAGSFNDIREELINNRVDSEDRKLRLQEQISTPLQQIGQTMFPDLDRLLQDLETNLDDARQGPPAADLVVEQADDILNELDQVLQKMLELETFNELVDIVRDLLEQQQKLIEDTEKEQKRQVLELLK